MAESLQKKTRNKLNRQPRQVVELTQTVDIAYQAIKEAILVGELKSGDVLPEKELAEELGVSRTPIREALQKLRDEGLVVLERYRKNYVAHFSEDDVTEIIEIRASLEGHIARRAAARIDVDGLERLRGLISQMEAIVSAAEAGFEEKYAAVNTAFHNTIWEIADTPRAEKILKSTLNAPFNMLGRFDNSMVETLERACSHHRDILSAFENRDAKLAGICMQDHLLSLTKVEP